MGYWAYEGGGLFQVLGGLVILIGIGLAVYLEYLSRGNWVIALVLFVVLAVVGAMMISRGAYARKQNTPIGREELAREK